jgi:hypothetical protein
MAAQKKRHERGLMLIVFHDHACTPLLSHDPAWQYETQYLIAKEKCNYPDEWNKI